MRSPWWILPFALLLAGGTAVAVLALVSASLLADVLDRRVWWKALFNVGQYTLAMTAAGLVIALGTEAGPGGLTEFTSRTLPPILLAGVVFVLINVGLTGVAVAHTEVEETEVVEGELLTVYPEGAVGDVDAQAVLIREEPGRFAPDPERSDWAPEGIVIYSKLCTHMACPVGLYQQQQGTLLCPCHQASFDVLDGGRAVHGPARRALPQLPIRIGADDTLVARGDFSDAVGTGFWGRP